MLTGSDAGALLCVFVGKGVVLLVGFFTWRIWTEQTSETFVEFANTEEVSVGADHVSIPVFLGYWNAKFSYQTGSSEHAAFE